MGIILFFWWMTTHLQIFNVKKLTSVKKNMFVEKSLAWKSSFAQGHFYNCEMAIWMKLPLNYLSLLKNF